MNVRKKWSVFVKDYLTDDKRVKPTSAWTHKWANSERGTEQFIELGFDKRIFKNPKPIGLIQAMLKMATQQNDVVLDFFAGSGSTAHAVLDLNRQDPKSSRNFICVQIDEPVESNHAAYTLGYRKISSVSKHRILKAIQNADDKQGFKCFELSSSNIQKWNGFESQKDGLLPDLFSKLESAFKNPLVEGTTPEEFISEVMLQEGFPLTAKQTEVQDGIFKISHDWVPYTLYVSMLQSFKNIDLEALGLSETDHFVCLDMAFEKQ